MLMCGIEVPTAGSNRAHPADCALFRRLAAALVPDPMAHPAADPAVRPGLDPADSRRAQWLLHYVMGTFFRRYLSRLGLHLIVLLRPLPSLMSQMPATS